MFGGIDRMFIVYGYVAICESLVQKENLPKLWMYPVSRRPSPSRPPVQPTPLVQWVQARCQCRCARGKSSLLESRRPPGVSLGLWRTETFYEWITRSPFPELASSVLLPSTSSFLPLLTVVFNYRDHNHFFVVVVFLIIYIIFTNRPRRSHLQCWRSHRRRFAPGQWGWGQCPARRWHSRLLPRPWQRLHRTRHQRQRQARAPSPW